MIRRPRRDERFERAFDDLFPRARVLAYRILGNQAAAEDAAAEALARLCLRWPKLGEADYVDAWVLRVATNVALDVAKRGLPPTLPSATLDVEDATAVRLALGHALRALPRRQREVVALRYLGDLSETDIAEALGITPGSVKTHASRALATLRRDFAAEGKELGFAPHGS